MDLLLSNFLQSLFKVIAVSNNSSATTAGSQPRTMPAATGSEVTLRQIVDQLHSGRWTVLRVTLWVFALGVAVCFLWPPSFQAYGNIQVEDDTKLSPVSNSSQMAPLLIGSPDVTSGEIVLMTSRSVLDPVIAKMHLDIDAYPKHFPIFGSFVSRYLNGDVKQPAGALWGFRSWAWGGEKIAIDSMTVPFSWFNSSMTLVAKERGSFAVYNFWGTELLHGRVGEDASSADGRFAMHVSELRAAPGTHFSVTKYSMDDAEQNTIKAMSVQELATGAGVINVTYSGPSRDLVERFINNLEESYLQQNSSRRAREAQRSLQFLQGQLPDFKRQMEAAQGRLSDYQQQHGMPDVSNQTDLLLHQATDLETKRLSLVTELDKARETYTPDHPSVRSLMQQIASVEREQGALKERIDKLPPTQQSVLTLTRDVDAYTTLYHAMLGSIQSYEVSKAGVVGNVQIVDESNQPYKPHFPKLILMLPLSLVLGLLFGMMWPFVQRGMLRGIDDPAMIEAATGLKVRAQIPFSGTQREIDQLTMPAESFWQRLRLRRRLLSRQVCAMLMFWRKKRPLPESGSLLASFSPDDAAIEALRSLRTNLPVLTADARNNVLMICGPGGNVGTSFVAANFGAVLAQGGKRVVVVDGNLRDGELHKVFGAAQGGGVAEVVSSATAPEPVIRHSGIAGLDYVACGVRRAGAADLLSQPRFADLIEGLSTSFDWVLLIAPPVLAFTDAALIGKCAGVTLLALKAAQHGPEEMGSAVERLASAGVRIGGVVLNQVGALPGSYGYGK
jgi:tyrosine-protein kinase Etk/Wzc